MANLLRKGNRKEPASLPPQSNRQKVSDTLPTQTTADDSINPWDQAQIWIESVQKEDATRKQWEQMYGFLADYDPKGNLKVRARTLENSTRFSNTLPNSRGHEYGWRLQTDVGQQIKNMQIQFDEQFRIRVPKEVLGYD
ncbi:unnamed protein product [Didymodactylos carnosus]|uniref:Uncharacterized protein n=1 Tax=Didymodactylos carnosus TaxID=1234261 RepID=A0A814DBF3_9BILA|nr:unnamed protein product [Didymodactylos carnosus]CAF1314218.1 unnamed protein product [Didymodactylos carnosus]CAF3728538.1 unnamed protein product [Didymodactylos carnosus]CAF4122900.1 unnamed protein product [Didymodactylos carnosus]